MIIFRISTMSFVTVAKQVANRLVVGDVMGSILGQHRVIAKDVKSFTYCCYVKCKISIVRVKGMPWYQNRRNSFPCTVITSRQRSYNQRVSRMLWLVSKPFGPAKRSVHRLLSTIP